MAMTFKVLALLLAYPAEDLRGHVDDIARVIDEEALLPAAQRAALGSFVEDLAARDLLDAQERYVGLFDRSRSLSLHLYEHIHGESRDRGQAMVNLANLYHRHGLAISAHELPDYLPLFLEFLSILPDAEARGLLGEAVPVIAALAERLTARDPGYAAVVEAVASLADRRADRAKIDEILGVLKPEADSLEALDRQWEEEAVRFTAAGAPDSSFKGGAGMAACALAPKGAKPRPADAGRPAFEGGI